MSNQVRRFMMVFSLVVLLGSSKASAAPFGGGLFTRGLSQAWEVLGGALGFSPKHRYGIDPNGLPCTPQPERDEARCGIDPDGVPCVPKPQLKHGCGIDPDGVVRCVP
jgi:hypothetical protein